MGRRPDRNRAGDGDVAGESAEGPRSRMIAASDIEPSSARTPLDKLTDHLLAALFWARQSEDRVVEATVSSALRHIARTYDAYDAEAPDEHRAVVEN